MMTSVVVPGANTDILSKIRELKQSMDKVEFAPDGFSASESEDSSDEKDQENIGSPAEGASESWMKTGKKIVPNLALKSSYFERRGPLKLHRGTNHAHHLHITTKSTLFSRKDHHKRHNNHIAKDGKFETQTHAEKVTKEFGNNAENDNCKAKEDVSNQVETFDDADLLPIQKGQCKDDVNVPIMSLPPPEVTPKYEFSMNSRSFSHTAMFAKALSYRFLTAVERITCNFSNDKSNHETKFLIDNGPQKECFCSTASSSSDLFGGWEITQTSYRAKIDRKRRSLKTNEAPFTRLTQSLGKDPVMFHHYKDSKKYIERYRFYHTINNVGRPQSYKRFSEESTATDPYNNKLKSNIR